MITEVKKTIRTLNGERSDSRPSRKRCMIPEDCSRRRVGRNRSMNHCPIRAVTLGNIAASRNTSKAPRKATLPHKATSWIVTCHFPTGMTTCARFANWVRLKKTKASMTTPSKMRSTMIVASEAEIGTPSRRFSTTARSTSPARAG